MLEIFPTFYLQCMKYLFSINNQNDALLHVRFFWLPLFFSRHSCLSQFTQIASRRPKVVGRALTFSLLRMSLTSRTQLVSLPKSQYFNRKGPDAVLGGFPNRTKARYVSQFTKKHGTHAFWWGFQTHSVKPFGIEKFDYTPRLLLDRWMFRQDYYDQEHRIPDSSRWEKIVNGKRVTEDRWALVEEEGEMHKVNWKLYSERIETELRSSYENVPQYRYWMDALPSHWKWIDVGAAKVRNLSVREGLAQSKLDSNKCNFIVGRTMELAQQGAEAKGLDKDKLRVSDYIAIRRKGDRQMNIKSKGYWAWATLQSSEARVTLTEDPEMVLPDRSALPYSSIAALRKAGIPVESAGEVIDVPAITAEGI